MNKMKMPDKVVNAPSSLPRINWIGATALALGGSNLSLMIFGGLFAGQGTMAIVLLSIAVLVAWLQIPGWLKLVLKYPNKVGGIAPAAAESLRPYSQILGTIIGIGYWAAWVPASSFGALFFSMTLERWFFPGMSVPLVSILIILVMTAVSLLGLKWACRVAIPIAIVAIAITFLSILIPLFTGQINWTQAFTYQLVTPFPGWFGDITSIMAGLYLLGWVAPAFEPSICYVGEMDDKKKKKQVSYALIACGILAGIYFIALPLVWYGTLGAEPLGKDFISVPDLSKIFVSSFGEKPAQLIAFLFLISSTLASTLTPLCSSPRTLAQLAEDGFIPKIFSRRTAKNQVPWVATLATGGVAIIIVIAGTPVWLMAATNFDYLICISVASIMAYLVFHENHADDSLANSFPQNHHEFGVSLGLLAAGFWILTTLLGFQQFGLPTVIIGIIFAFSGVLLFIYRRISDRIHQGLPGIMPSMQLKLTGTILIVLLVDSLGYLIAVLYIGKLATNVPMVTLLEDIFVLVALLSISIGVIVPGMIVAVTENISQAASRLAKETLADFSNAMIALGQGDLEHATVSINVDPIPVHSHDEMGVMAESFNYLRTEMLRSVEGLKGAREKLIRARQELIEINEGLEKRISERTKELTVSNRELKQALDDLTLAKDRLVDIEKIASLGELVVGITHEVNTPIGISVTAISQLKDEIEQIKEASRNKTLTRTQLDQFVDSCEESEYLIENNLKRAVSLITSFKQISADQISESPRSFPLKGYLEEIVLSLKPLLKKTKLKVIIECPEDLVINSYPGIIFQIITIFMMNSLTHAFNPSDEGEISIRVLEEGKNIILRYSDTGLGIAPEHIKKVFEPFFTTKRGSGGIGLGLHIAYNRVIQVLNGTLRCESTLGHGATFIATFPKEGSIPSSPSG